MDIKYDCANLVNEIADALTFTGEKIHSSFAYWLIRTASQAVSDATYGKEVIDENWLRKAIEVTLAKRAKIEVVNGCMPLVITYKQAKEVK